MILLFLGFLNDFIILSGFANFLSEKARGKTLDYKLIDFKEGLIGPHYRETPIILRGKRKNIPRYRCSCKGCQKIFNVLIGTHGKLRHLHHRPIQISTTVSSNSSRGSR